MKTDYQTIVVEENSGVVKVLLNRPEKRHAVNQLLADELFEVLDTVSKSADIRAVVLSTTDQFFCAGADLEEGLGKYPSGKEQILEMYWPVLEKVEQMPQVFISAIPGVSAGIGCALAMNSDLVVMHPKSALYFAFSKIGLIADGGSHWFLLQQLGYQKTFELLVQGGSLSAQECFDKGFANKLEEQPLEAALAWAQELAQCAPLALRETKQCLRKMANVNFKQAVELEADGQKICTDSDDSKEGIQAFLQKRKPVFTGK